MEYDDYSKTCDEIHAKNDEYLALFKQDLVSDGLKESTIRRHHNGVRNGTNRFFSWRFLYS